MQTFKQTHTGTWEVILTIQTIRDIEAHTGINLGLPDIGDPSVFRRVTSDAALAARILWIACQKSAKTHGIPEDQFYDDILVGKVFEEAHQALLKEWRDFFQSRSIGGTGQRLAKAVSVFLDLINSGNSSTNSPASSESSPTNSP